MDKLDLLRDDEFENKPPTKWDLFEAMDRTSSLMSQVENSLHNHSGLNEEQARMAQDAFVLLFDIYQIAGARFFEMTKDE
jgi:hypothetical protein